ncbi:DUF2235 domain-containing protein [Rhodococcus opacus]|uniref:DUF2235 domain-containing protein n=1 Tax=Rhodococcus opacus TaxID=37919 RepID=A0AAX3YR09_RHOOP|nr:DUF2235 domain-containing protein [Rhodococcus opacus]MCZ4587710.1 DUF2235 domain-containing protein [Rhodococcus opacus]WLF51295.1 DUF2235 domain-containing protein [Rhodococcus opacus]
MKRLVVCCDGTWKRADDQNVSNIEKIARAIDTTLPAGKPAQVVYYNAGVGTGATRVEHFIGGITGLGLDYALVSAYRFLALNYDPDEDDEIFVFGFSRGAYTARSLVGMIATIGLLKPLGIVQDNLHLAIDVYRHRPNPVDPAANPKATKAVNDFQEACYDDDQVCIRFLGVFDTVGALGIPVLSRGKYKFHNVELDPKVVTTARQALAIDERRRAFAPAVWTTDGDGRAHPDVKQVWFEGVHTDIGGGYPESALSDLALMWMVREAKECGLVFHEDRVNRRLQSKPMERHNSMTCWYGLLNIGSLMGQHLGLAPRIASRFRGSHRCLEAVGANESQKDLSILIADKAYERRQERSRSTSNIEWWKEELESESIDPATRIEVLPSFAGGTYDPPELEYRLPFMRWLAKGCGQRKTGAASIDHDPLKKGRTPEPVPPP